MKTVSSLLDTAPACKVFLLCFIGILAGRNLSAGDQRIFCAAAICLGLVFLLLLLFEFVRPSTTLVAILTPGLCTMLGAVKIIFDLDREPRLPEKTGFSPVVIGTVADDPERTSTRTRFLLQAEQLVSDSSGKPFRTKVMVSLLPTSRDTARLELAYGMKIAVRGWPERPSAERNPGEFSLRTYFEANGITHVLTLKGTANLVILQRGGGSWWVRSVVLPARRWMLRTFERSTGGEEGEFLKGLILGERGGMSAMTKEAFVNAGVAHVLAVSGSNVAVVAAIFFLLLELLRVPRQARVLPVLAGLVFYMLVTGSQPPVERATIMAAVILIGRLIQRRVNPWNSLGVSGLVILAIDARQAFDIGFQLSYGAVLSLMALYPVMNRWITAVSAPSRSGRILCWLLRVCAVSLAATLGTLPLTAICFGRVSVIGVLANIVVIPATELSVLLGAATLGGALCSNWIAGCYGALNWLILHWTLLVARLAGFSPVAYIDTVRFGLIDAVPYYAVLIALFAPLTRKPQRIAITVLAAGAFTVLLPAEKYLGPRPALLRVSFIDVGQGDAILVEFPDNATLLIDAGPRSARFDAGEKTVLPFLRRRGVSALDVVVLTHNHADHIGGLPSVAAGMPIHRVLSLSPAALRGTLGVLYPERLFQCDSVESGQVIPVSPSARVYVLYPVPGGALGQSGGNESIVLKVAYGNISFLLTGDAETGQEQLLAGRYGEFLQALLMKAGHHGSRTSSSEEFVELVRPCFAAVSVGEHNKFRHPSPSVLRRFASQNVEVSRTDEEGAVIFETDGSSLWKYHWN
ncbi:MAG: DNA internalization-related competence protein ComEC/Rec2 [Bacteroidota bacterium]